MWNVHQFIAFGFEKLCCVSAVCITCTLVCQYTCLCTHKWKSKLFSLYSPPYYLETPSLSWKLAYWLGCLTIHHPSLRAACLLLKCWGWQVYTTMPGSHTVMPGLYTVTPSFLCRCWGFKLRPSCLCSSLLTHGTNFTAPGRCCLYFVLFGWVT